MIAPTIQFGLETEIGISSDVQGEVDVVSESIALVRSATEPGVWMCWDYDCEDPHVDMRGFRVHELRQDTDRPTTALRTRRASSVSSKSKATWSWATARDSTTTTRIRNIARRNAGRWVSWWPTTAPANAS